MEVGDLVIIKKEWRTMIDLGPPRCAIVLEVGATNAVIMWEAGRITNHNLSTLEVVNV